MTAQVVYYAMLTSFCLYLHIQSLHVRLVLMLQINITCWCGLVCRDGLEDPLDDAGLVQQQLDQLSTIGRCEYEKTCALLVQLFDQAAQSYQELLQSTNSSAVDITVQEGKNCTELGT